MHDSQMVIFTFISGVILGALCFYIAKKRGSRRPLLWFVVGLLCGVVGLLILLALPNKKRSAAQTAFVNSSPLLVDKEVGDRMAITNEPEITPSINAYPWYYIDRELKKQGPIDLLTLKRAWKQGKISQESYLWTDGMSDWEILENLSDIQKELNR